MRSKCSIYHRQRITSVQKITTPKTYTKFIFFVLRLTRSEGVYIYICLKSAHRLNRHRFGKAGNVRNSTSRWYQPISTFKAGKSIFWYKNCGASTDQHSQVVITDRSEVSLSNQIYIHRNKVNTQEKVPHNSKSIWSLVNVEELLYLFYLFKPRVFGSIINNIWTKNYY